MTNDEIIRQVLFFLIGLLPVLVIYLRGRAKSAETLIEAQKIINERFSKVTEDLDKTKDELNVIKVQYAEERGGLNQRIKALEDELSRERNTGEARSRENFGMISALQSQLSELKLIQGELQANAKRLTEERDKILEAMRQNNDELSRLKDQVYTLTELNKELQVQLERKEKELSEIRLKLNGNE